MPTPHLLIGFSDIPDGELAAKSAHIITDLTGNANFPSPFPSLADVQAKVDAYNNARSHLPNGTPEQTALKNEARTALIATLQQLATFLENQAGGNLAKLLSTGFDVSKEPEPVGVLPAPANLVLKTKDEVGTLYINFDKVPGAMSYLIMYTASPVTPASVWTPIVSTKTRWAITDLTSGQKYAVKVAAVGANATRNFSTTEERFVI